MKIKKNYFYYILFIFFSCLIPFFSNLISIVFFYSFILPLTISQDTVIFGINQKIAIPEKIYFYLVEIFPFIVPFSLGLFYILPIFYYIKRPDIENYKRKLCNKIFNTPLIAGLIGITGWIFAFLISQVLYLIFFEFLNPLILISFFLLNLVKCLSISILCFGISYYFMELFNRKIFIPKFFPDGNLSTHPGIIPISVRSKFFIYFFAISIYPLLFIIFSLLKIYITKQYIQIELLLWVSLIFMIIGGVFTYLFSKTFQNPLIQIRNVTKKISEGNYDIKVFVNSADEIGHLGESINKMSIDLKESDRKLKIIRYATIFGLAKLAENRDDSTGKHLERIREYSILIAKRLSIDPKYSGYITDYYINDIYESSILHDIGKVGIPDSILLKPGKLEKNEFEIIKQHTIIGGDALNSIEHEIKFRSFLTMAIHIAYCHHEKWNGKGYPKGMKGEEIPLSARIVALADVYDALTTKRPYKDAWTHDEAKETILKDRGEHHDPLIVDAFLKVEKEFKKVNDHFKDYNK